MILSCLCYWGKHSSDSHVANAQGKAKGTGPKLDGWLGGTVCTSASRVSQQECEPDRGTQTQHTPAAPGTPQSCALLKPHCPPPQQKDVQGSRSLEHHPYGRAVRKDARATCGKGASARDTCVEAKDTSDYWNRELCSHLKLNWTCGISAKTFVRLLVCACMLCRPWGEQAMLLLCMSEFHQWGGWERLFHSSAHREPRAESVGISSTKALVYTLPTALIYAIFLTHLTLILGTLSTSFRHQYLWLFSLP